MASEVALVVKNLPANARDIRDVDLIPGSGRCPEGGHGRETQVPSLGWEDPLEKGTATQSSILAWRIPWTI